MSTGELNQAVKRNVARFPIDFAFKVTNRDREILKSQFVISSVGHGCRRSQAWAFTEHGAITAASVLNSRRAIDISIDVAAFG